MQEKQRVKMIGEEPKGFFIRLRQNRGFTVIQGIAVLGVCLGFLALAQTGYRAVVNTSVTNTGTFVTSTAP